MKAQPIEKMDPVTKLKMKFVFDVIDYIGENYPIIAMDNKIGIGFNAAMTPEDEPCLIMEIGRNYQVTVGDLKTGRLAKLKPEIIYSHLTITNREEILQLKDFDFFKECYYKLLRNFNEKTLEVLQERFKEVSTKESINDN